MHTSLLHLNPDNQQDLLWDFARVGHMIPKEVHATTEHFNQTGFEELIKPLRRLVQADEVTGIDYALLGSASDSGDEAVVHFNPFANGMTDNMLLRAGYLKKAFDGLDISDKQGQSLSLITLSAPSGSHRIKLQKHHHKATAKGDFTSLARHYLSIIQRHGYKKLRVIGFSQGASLAMAAAAIASQLKLQVSHVAIGEPANIIRRPKRTLVRDFVASAADLREVVRSNNMTHVRQVHAQENRLRYCVDILRRSRLNTNLARGLSKATFIKDFEAALAQDVRVTIGFGGLTTVCPPLVMREVVERVRREPHYPKHFVHTVEVKDAQHAWADQLDILATFYGYALTR